jgi:hypothetical protein
VIELAMWGVLLFVMGIVLMGANEIKIGIRYLLLHCKAIPLARPQTNRSACSTLAMLT